MPTILPLPRSSPEAQGISSAAINDFVTTVENNIHSLHSFMLLRHGYIVAEGWWYPWRAEAPHVLFSLSKSFTSTAIGLAVGEGRLRIDDLVISFFPAEVPRKVSENLAEMKVRHLLTMTSGHDQDTTEDVFNSRTPVKTFLSLPVVHAPGTHFLYNTGATFMLSAIMQKLSGQTLLEYLTPRLFEPLGITGATWESHPCGVNYGGMGLSIKTEDIARFGQLYLQKGQWNGGRILDESWVEAASARQVPNGDDPNSDWCQGYGFQFWCCRHNCYRGDGAFGQYCIVMPEQQAVLAITAGVADMQKPLNLVWEKLLPAMDTQPLSMDEAKHSVLVNKLSHLSLAPSGGASSSSMASAVSGIVYTFEPNYETLHSLSFDFGKEACTLTYRLLGGGKRRGMHQVVCGYGSWMEGISYLGGLLPQKVAASGVWVSEDTFSVMLCYYETPFILTMNYKFDGRRVIYNCVMNVAFGELERPLLIGMATS